MSAATVKLVPYYRVSTKAQERSGLGLDAQQATVSRYRDSVNGTMDHREFREIETGTKKRHRPVLAEALRYCERTGSRLVVAKLDRLARNARFLLGIVESGADVVFCDLPNIPPGPVGKFILTNMAAAAELEAGLIAVRVKESLAGFKTNRKIPLRLRKLYGDNVPPELVEATAGKLGASLPQCRNLTDEARHRGAATTALKARAKAVEANSDLAPRMLAWRNEGKSLKSIAAALNDAGETTRTGCSWSATQVRRVLERVG